ncbi:MAG: imidazole glycerol-phosphate synthase subunit HisH [Solirubrobacteraceae bacterium]|nr:imidazole glycerol-phosphate synthase subunit HisH [Solirubrobacteraceae bacterium]
MIAVVDYGMGNRRSVEKAIVHVGGSAIITRDHEAIRAADGVVVPGVGAFPRAMEHLRELGLDDLLRERAAAGVPLLGICLGMQLLFEESEEHGGAAGLGLVPGTVRYLDTQGRRLPHIGWNLVSALRPGTLLRGDAAYYHVHSLACHPADPDDVAGVTTYGETFCTVIERGNVAGCQFHPEKSSRDGLALLRGFVEAA